MSPVAIGVGGFNRGKKPAAAGGGGGTFTINPSAQSGVVISEAYSYIPQTYADARNGTGAISASPGSQIVVGQNTVHQFGDTYTPAGDDYACYEAFLDFNLSSLVGTVSSATLSLGLNIDFSTQDFIIEARVRDWGSTLETTDWVAGGSISGTIIASLSTTGIGATQTYKIIPESGTALQNAVTAAGNGILRLMLCSDRLRNGDIPNTSEYVFFHHYNHATLAPKLVIVTT